MNTKFYLIALFLFISFLANAQWDTDTNGINYNSATGKVRIGTAATTDRTLLVYNATLPYFGVKNDLGSLLVR